jgi:hypothetical protein
VQQAKGLSKAGSQKGFLNEDEREIIELIIKKFTSEYMLKKLVCSSEVRNELEYFIKKQLDQCLIFLRIKCIAEIISGQFKKHLTPW